jgi:hypothetical protein
MIPDFDQWKTWQRILFLGILMVLFLVGVALEAPR